MKLEQATFLAALYLLPAIAFVLGFRSCARLDRSQGADTALLISTVIAAATVLHVVLGLVFLFGVLPITGLAPPAAGEALTAATQRVATQMNARWWAWPAYGVFCSLASFSAGAGMSTAIVWGLWRTRLYHGPLYPMLVGFARRVIFVDVLSQTSISDGYVLYSGFLEDVRISSNGRVEWVLITFATKRLFIGSETFGAAPSTGPSRDIISSFPTSQKSNFQALLIEGEDIQNIYFTSVATPDDLLPAWKRGLRSVFRSLETARRQNQPPDPAVPEAP